MKPQAMLMLLASFSLSLIAVLVAPDSLHQAAAFFAWGILFFYLAAIAQTGSLSGPAVLISWPFLFLPITVIQLIIKILSPAIYAVKWAIGIPAARRAPAIQQVPRTWAEVQTSPYLRRFRQQPGFRLLLGSGRTRLIDALLGDNIHHLLITGATGAGKSSVIRTFLCVLLLDGPGLFDRLSVHILDNKGGLGRPFLPIIQAFENFVVFRDEDAILADLEFLKGQITVRQAAMDDALAEQPEDIDLSRILVIIDDLQDIIDNKDIEAAIASIASKGRSAGVHLVCSMPYSKADLIKTTITINFGRISGFIRDKAATRSIGIDGLNTLGDYQFGFEDTVRLKPVLFQPYYISPQDVRDLAGRFVSGHRSPAEILVELFIQEGGLGRRELARRGLAQAKVLYGSAALSGTLTASGNDIPFPFSEIEIDSDTSQPRMTAAARDFIVDVIRRMVEIGLASPPPTMGEAYRPTTRNVTDAIARWREKANKEAA